MTITHPHQLHASAVLWSLTASYQRLLAADSAADAAAAASGDLGTLQAWRPGSGVHNGGDGDMLLDAVIRHSTPGATNPYAERRDRTEQTLIWIAKAATGVDVATGTTALTWLIDHLPRTPQQAARHVARWVDEQDQAVRKVLRDGDDRQHVPEIACPHCDTAGALALRTSAPPSLRVVVCTAGCTCDGPGCGCAMGVEVLGVPHIWSTEQIEVALR